MAFIHYRQTDVGLVLISEDWRVCSRVDGWLVESTIVSSIVVAVVVGIVARVARVVVRIVAGMVAGVVEIYWIVITRSK